MFGEGVLECVGNVVRVGEGEGGGEGGLNPHTPENRKRKKRTKKNYH